ncbi:MAG TPA: DUF305 domain-containing protein [Gemmatimonadales bacterium]|nr:DUF305 domain-containing protein [Gemmatimonadales bacterium]
MRTTMAALLAAAALTACSRATQGRSAPDTAERPSPKAESDLAAIARARADSARHPYTAADIAFMSGMIAHHSQAIVMARMAPSHGAGASLRRLAERIINAQQDEIVTMQRWLGDRLQPVPPADTSAMGMMDMAGTGHAMLMPGMLTHDQMMQLDQARDAEFDRLFLTFMIQHHRGAVTMVKDLFDTYGAAQDQLTFKLASDVNVDQTTEIARMERMLAILELSGNVP